MGYPHGNPGEKACVVGPVRQPMQFELKGIFFFLFALTFLPKQISAEIIAPSNETLLFNLFPNWDSPTSWTFVGAFSTIVILSIVLSVVLAMVTITYSILTCSGLTWVRYFIEVTWHGHHPANFWLKIKHEQERKRINDIQPYIRQFHPHIRRLIEAQNLHPDESLLEQKPRINAQGLANEFYQERASHWMVILNIFRRMRGVISKTITTDMVKEMRQKGVEYCRSKNLNEQSTVWALEKAWMQFLLEEPQHLYAAQLTEFYLGLPNN